MKLVTKKTWSPFPGDLWSAIDDDTYDLDEPVGYGATEKEAIEDLLWKIEDRKERNAVIPYPYNIRGFRMVCINTILWKKR